MSGSEGSQLETAAEMPEGSSAAQTVDLQSGLVISGFFSAHVRRVRLEI